ncbi:MAG: alpha amylase C-terminal domain-containing protein, partial [Bacteroidales bacterium]|nr:alpha amylase C-terminal domain-containing protein [Bacteroidales bacterium]
DEEKKILLLERAGLVFAFNFNPEQSFDRYGFSVAPGAYETVLDSDAARFGGFARNDDAVAHLTVPEGEGHTLYLYLPARTVQVLRMK